MGAPGPEPKGEPAPAPDERPYGLDDLVAHEKRNLRLVLAIFLAAMGWYALRGRVRPGPDPGAGAQPAEARSAEGARRSTAPIGSTAPR